MQLREMSERVKRAMFVIALYYLWLHIIFNNGKVDMSAEQIRETIEELNENQYINNEDKYGPVLNDTIIIAIQVHNRTDYLRHLITSLSLARHVEKTLLIFSHDIYDEDINGLVISINFTKVLQIFFPYSIQTHPHGFPGPDCSLDLDDESTTNKCKNIYGDYRVADLSQTKHHWWWKANRIFNQLECTTNHTGLVLFLEEDNYVSEDFIHMLIMLRPTAAAECPQCEMLVLGLSDLTNKSDKVYKHLDRFRHLILPIALSKTIDMEKLDDYYDDQINTALTPFDFRRVEITDWNHNTGFAFNRTVWNSIVHSQYHFCYYNDYNWDFSFLHLSRNRPGKAFKVMACVSPRVIHIGKCGIHHKESNCDVSTQVYELQKLQNNTRDFLYPTSLEVSVNDRGKRKVFGKQNGGWRDKRDQQLCVNMSKKQQRTKKVHTTSTNKNYY